jgi:hypothetical protein
LPLEKKTYWRDIAVLLVLLAASGDSQEKDNYPRYPNLGPHFQVDGANSRVEASAHENIISHVTRHSDLISSRHRNKIDTEGNGKAIDHRDGHDVSIIVDDLSQAEDVVVVQAGRCDHGGVKRPEGVALVHQGFVAQRRDWEAFLHKARHNPSQE